MKLPEKYATKNQVNKKKSVISKKTFLFSAVVFTIITFPENLKITQEYETEVHPTQDLLLSSEKESQPEVIMQTILNKEETFHRTLKYIISEVSKVTGVSEEILWVLVCSENAAVTTGDHNVDSQGSFFCKIYHFLSTGCSTSLLQLKVKSVIREITKNSLIFQQYKNELSTRRTDFTPAGYNPDDYKKFFEPALFTALYVKEFSDYYFSDNHLKHLFTNNNFKKLFAEPINTIDFGAAKDYLENDMNLIITLFSTDIKNEEKINNRIAQSLYIGGFIPKPYGLEDANYYNMRSITLEGVRYLEESLGEKIKTQYVYNTIYWVITSKEDVGTEITRNIHLDSQPIQRKNRKPLINKILFQNIGFYKGGNLQGGYKKRKQGMERMFEIEDKDFGKNIGKNIIHNIINVYGKKYLKKDISSLSGKEKSLIFMQISKDMFKKILNENDEYSEALYNWYDTYEIKSKGKK